MADVLPFAAFRPASGLESRIAALPYDVFRSEEAREEVRKNPESFLAIDRAETMLPDGTAFDDPKVYVKARALLEEKVRSGKFVQDEKPCYYVYSQTWNGRTQTGITALCSIDDYVNGVIRKHENTREDKEQDRIRHVDTCNAQTGPIFLAYRSNPEIARIVTSVMTKPPVCDFISSGDVRNRVFIIDDEKDIAVIRDAFRQISSVYIADGHHRCASAVKVGLQRREERREGKNSHPAPLGHASLPETALKAGAFESDYFLSVFFPEDELEILDYNRVLKTLGDNTGEEILTKIAKAGFAVGEESSDVTKPTEKGEFGLYLGGKWRLLTAGPEIRSSDPVDGLDVSILQNHVLGPIFGIGDPRTDPKIDFVGGIRGPEELVRRCSLDGKAAFLMHPTSIQELFAVADAGRLMPPKSTWFEPKLLSGLFIHAL